MGLGGPAIITNQKKEPSGAPFAAGSANNGLSVDPVSGKIVLGDVAGSPGQLAKLLDNREIPVDPITSNGVTFVDATGNGDTTNINEQGVTVTNGAGNQGQLQSNDVVFSAASGAQGFLSFANLALDDATGQAHIIITPGIVEVIDNITNAPVVKLARGANNYALDVDPNLTREIMRLHGPGAGFFSFDVQNYRFGINVTPPTAALHIKAGVAAVSGAPFKYTAGVAAQTIVENGAKNFDGNNETIAAGGVTYTLAKTLTATAVLDFPNTATLTSSDLTVNVVGAADGDVVALGVPIAALNANSSFSAFVSAPGVVTVRFSNYSALSIDPASGTFRVSLVKY